MSVTQDKIDQVANDGERASIEDITSLLKLNGDDLLSLFKNADAIRRERMGDTIYVRGIINISTFCKNSCNFCSMRSANTQYDRYRMTPGEVANIAHQAMHFGCTTVILQSGNDSELTCGHLCELADRITLLPNMSVALACGARKSGEFSYLRQYGFDKYYLRFETTSKELYETAKRDDSWDSRLEALATARANDMQIASGFLTGWPHTSTELIAQDILFTTQWKLDEIWCDPFIPQKDTPMACKPMLDDRQIYFKTIAILRLLNPTAHIMSSPAYNSVLKYGSDRCLLTGANTFVVNITPERYTCPGALYSEFTSERDKTAQASSQLLARVLKLNRNIGQDTGPSFRTEWVNNHPDDYETT